jgi:hypothetical protein
MVPLHHSNMDPAITELIRYFLQASATPPAEWPEKEEIFNELAHRVLHRFLIGY